MSQLLEQHHFIVVLYTTTFSTIMGAKWKYKVLMVMSVNFRGVDHMSGPALTQKHAHHAIHEATLGEAEELTALLKKMISEGDETRALELADVLIEHWETRTLRHAEAEEEGLYADIVQEKPEMKDTVVGLTRDHDLLRILVKQIKNMISEDGVNDAVLNRFEAMILVNEIHSRDEEEHLL